MLNKLLKVLHFLEDSVLILLTLAVLFLSCAPLVLRNLGVSGFSWSGTAVSVGVLWLAIFGALRASREQSHISIDLVAHYLPERLQFFIHIIVSLFCTATCAIATYYGVIFILGEKADGSIAFLNVPVWLCEAIIPFGFAILALRFLFNMLTLPKPHEQSV